MCHSHAAQGNGVVLGPRSEPHASSFWLSLDPRGFTASFGMCQREAGARDTGWCGHPKGTVFDQVPGLVLIDQGGNKHLSAVWHPDSAGFDSSPLGLDSRRVGECAMCRASKEHLFVVRWGNARGRLCGAYWVGTQGSVLWSLLG